MKWLIWIISVLNLCFISTTYAAEIYTFDPYHTYVLWSADHVGFTTVCGKWQAEGTLTLDEKNLPASKVNVIIKTAELGTAIPEFDTHLKGKLFFDVQKFPTATFTSNKVIPLGHNNAKIEGTLTVRNIAKPVVLEVHLNKRGINPLTEKQTLGFTAKTTVKRSDFGILTMLPEVGDKVEIKIEAEAIK